MDRLVNQLLTEIDGFEELRGVYVIATSSRPDTVDPALLRPGRLDNLLFLDWPTEKERYDIMWKLTRDIKTDPDVNLCAIAGKKCRTAPQVPTSKVYSANVRSTPPRT